MKISKQYFLANLLFFIVFIAIILFLLFFNQHVGCPYKAANLPCSTCGLTRTFLVVFRIRNDFHPSFILLNLTYFFLGQMLLRFLLIILQRRIQFSRKWILADGIVSSLWFLTVIVPFYR